MKTTYVCPDCGQEMENNQNDCPNCGCPKEHLKSVGPNISPSLESSDDFSAEHTVNAIAKINLVFSIIIFVGCIFGAIIAYEDLEDMIAVILLIVGVVFLIVGIISWAVLRLIVNISYRLTRIDNKQK